MGKGLPRSLLTATQQGTLPPPTYPVDPGEIDTIDYMTGDLFTYNANVTPPPTGGQVRFNETLLTATKIWINKDTSDSKDIATKFRSFYPNNVIIPGTTMFIQNKGESSQYHKYKVIGVVDKFDTENYVEFDIVETEAGERMISGGTAVVVAFGH